MIASMCWSRSLMPGRTRSTSMTVGMPASRAKRAACVAAAVSWQSTTSRRPDVTASRGTAAAVQREAGMAVPEHRALARARVDQHDGELIGRARHGPRRADVHAFASQAVARQRAQLVVAEAADIACRPSQLRAHRHRGRDLAAGQPREPLEPLLRVGLGVLGDDGQQVDAVEAETGDVAAPRVPGRHLKRNTHGLDRI